MRTVFIGAGDLTYMTARELLSDGHGVIIIETDKDRIDELSAELDAGFIHGDGSKPAILREAGPTDTDFLFCLSGNDQSNIIASLVGRSLGYQRVVTRIEDPSYEHICIELGLADTIIPGRTIARYLAGMCAGQNPLEISAVIKGDARVFSFVAGKSDEGLITDLALPEGSRLMFLYHNDEFMLPDADTVLHEGDEIVLISNSQALHELQALWSHAPV